MDGWLFAPQLCMHSQGVVYLFWGSTAGPWCGRMSEWLLLEVLLGLGKHV